MVRLQTALDQFTQQNALAQHGSVEVIKRLRRDIDAIIDDRVFQIFPSDFLKKSVDGLIVAAAELSESGLTNF